MTILHIYDFETNLERAANAILTAAGVDSYVTRGREVVDEDNGVFLGVEIQGAVDSHVQVLPNGSQEFDFYTATMTVQIQISREADDTTRFKTLRSMIRDIFSYSKQPFNATNLPEYQVASIVPISTANTVENTKLLDICTMGFVIMFSVNFNNLTTS